MSYDPLQKINPNNMRNLSFVLLLVTVFISCTTSPSKEKIQSIQYINYFKGYKITTTMGSVTYRAQGWVESLGLKRGDIIDIFERAGRLEEHLTDSMYAKIVYYQYIEEEQDPNQIPPNYYAGRFEGIAIPDTTKLDEVVMFISPTEPKLGNAKLVTASGFNGEKLGWQLQ